MSNEYPYEIGQSLRVRLADVDLDGLQGRDVAPKPEQIGTQGTVLGVCNIIGPMNYLFAVKLDSGELIEAADYELTEDDELPTDPGDCAHVEQIMAATAVLVRKGH